MGYFSELQQLTVQVFVPVVEPVFALFQVQVECVRRDTVEFLEPAFSKAPEAFNAVDMGRAAHKLISSMIDSQMLTIAHINQAIIAALPVTVDRCFR